MSKKTSPITRRAWRLLRLALLWGRKGGRLSVLHKVIRKLVHSHELESRRALAYGDHEFSFDDTSPMVHVRMHRPASALRFKLPCIRPPQVDFDYEEGDDMSLDEAMWSFHAQSTCTLEDEGIDARAEEFIAKFYEQMKLQRQISYLEYS